MTRSSTVPPLRLLVGAAVVVLFLLPSVALAHAELETSTPKDGATVQGTPTEIVGTYSEAMTPNGSSLTLVGADGAVIARGDVDPADDTRMVITDVPELAPGTYTVRSTTKSAEDGDVDRKEWTFTVEAAPTPSPSPTPTPTAAPSATPVPTATPPPASPSPVPTASPTPSADGSSTGGGSDVLLPIIAAVVIIGAVAGYLFSRRDRTPTQP